MNDYKFRVQFLEDAKTFLDGLENNARKKILYNIWKARYTNDKVLLKKLQNEIWEFRTKYNKSYFRLFAFWDKTTKEDSVVICTHGFIKKTDKISKNDLQRAEDLRRKYFKSKGYENI
ncbi:type II toxin-antitoxin system RelE/ParE family toxin [Chryseobacterium salipaludis]|uniref:type II toxin-antitoxin system RelE/ParE family toxin n=1 Tax=Chryseobacterium TaxID=59732 RepID=UPI001FF23E8A|nr:MULTISPECIES: type II toxin-antitoxin system RelE/ParE family toxin [Chryseobacterium]MCJ8497029.1 type II toxin-antitoxin system RelE/ParE family toxin [Chryseobacterium salipaludis]MCX3296510.1 type II toxin-antitoxin system RelE/ParE family toxin [Planobacterium sp. JC490]